MIVFMRTDVVVGRYMIQELVILQKMKIEFDI